MNKRVLVTLLFLASFLTLSSALWPFEKATKETRRAARAAKQEAEKRGYVKPQPKMSEGMFYTEPTTTEGEVEEMIADDANRADTITPEDDMKASDDKLRKTWEQNMHNFVPEDMVNFILDTHTAQIFYEEINHIEPTEIKGAYYVHGGSDAGQLSAVMVLDPEKKVLYKRQNENQGIILFNTTMPGEYQVVFANFAKPGSQKVVTLAIHTYDDSTVDPIEYDFTTEGDRIIRFSNEQQENADSIIDEIAGDAEIGTLRNILRSVQTMSKQVVTETKMSMTRQDGHNEELQANGSWYFWCIVIETISFVIILVFQVRHLKGQLDNRLIM